MSRSKFFMVASVLANFTLIFVLTNKIQSPIIREVAEGNPQIIGQETESDPVESYKVVRVIDGDTIVLENDEVVRYIGIDAPEFSRVNECFSQESTNKNKELVLGEYIRLEKDISEKDKYGRLLRYVWVTLEPYQNEIFVNDYLIHEGYATSATFPPDIKYQDLFKQKEKDARENNRGLWKICKAI